ncbi:hypothetical protein EVAR_16700_1 [Eumeta japonica]|uniref:Uncharacterized protein n=1 Tax=Eumeta variegata TaxID=151549 RepID=A0A4C1V6L3_EUMVA|nr:hypothetical protein EVAR_16700_1 [Eumeta japonica]
MRTPQCSKPTPRLFSRHRLASQTHVSPNAATHEPGGRYAWIGPDLLFTPFNVLFLYGSVNAISHSKRVIMIIYKSTREKIGLQDEGVLYERSDKVMERS